MRGFISNTASINAPNKPAMPITVNIVNIVKKTAAIVRYATLFIRAIGDNARTSRVAVFYHPHSC